MRARYEQALADAEAFEAALQRAQDYHDVRLLLLLSCHQSLLSGYCVSANSTLEHVHHSTLTYYIWSICQEPPLPMQRQSLSG